MNDKTERVIEQTNFDLGDGMLTATIVETTATTGRRYYDFGYSLSHFGTTVHGSFPLINGEVTAIIADMLTRVQATVAKADKAKTHPVVRAYPRVIDGIGFESKPEAKDEDSA
jgi:hypothetical protein